MKKLLLLLIGIFAISCVNQSSSDTGEDISKKISGMQSQFFKLSSITDNKWDRLYVCGPYTVSKMFDDRLIKYKKDIMATNIDSRDDICVLLFFLNQRLVRQVTIKRNIDFSEMSKLDKNGHLVDYSPDGELSCEKTKNSTCKILYRK